MKISNDVWLIFLGSFLTVIATIIVETYKNFRDKQAKSKTFRLVILQELQSIKKLLEKFKTIFEYKSYYDYSVLNEIRKGITHLETERSQSIYLPNISMQEKYIDLVSDLSAFETDVRNIQDVFYNQQNLISEDLESTKRKPKAKRKSIFSSHKENMDVYSQRTTQKSIDLVEINRRLDELIKVI